ncbi:MAG: GNAT family N-acetyltransferase [Actinobacteria bacterium]|nr:GNAT family N-acetyltransferase [Actinomycetota bacterium]
MKLVQYAERRDLLDRRERLSGAFPTFMHHNEPGGRYWLRLYEEHPDFQLGLLDGDDVIAELHSVPTPWDGSANDLPSGWDEAFNRAFESDREPTVLCALAISVLPERRGEGLATRMIEAMREACGAGGLRELIAPVRPTLKERYPLIPIERYVDWRRADGTHFDPWIRIHEQVGGEILAVAPESVVIEAPASEWEEWTGLAFPEDGTFVVEGMLAPLEVRDGRGCHAEPNVWIRHPVP